jgi:hypothetical protein
MHPSDDPEKNLKPCLLILCLAGVLALSGCPSGDDDDAVTDDDDAADDDDDAASDTSNMEAAREAAAVTQEECAPDGFLTRIGAWNLGADGLLAPTGEIDPIDPIDYSSYWNFTYFVVDRSATVLVDSAGKTDCEIHQYPLGDLHLPDYSDADVVTWVAAADAALAAEGLTGAYNRTLSADAQYDNEDVQYTLLRLHYYDAEMADVAWVELDSETAEVVDLFVYVR